MKQASMNADVLEAVQQPVAKKEKKLYKKDILSEIFRGDKYNSMRELTRVNNWYFIRRLMLVAILITVSVVAILQGNLLLQILGTILLGGTYAHAVELQHQTLHYTAFSYRPMNRIVGVLLGMPMLVSYTNYQVSHLNHHRDLGTPENKEFFNYNYEKLRSISYVLPHLFMVDHFRDVGKYFFLSLVNRLDVEGTKEENKKMQNEYLLMLFITTTVVALSIYFGSLIGVYLWVFPMLFAIPLHALIELPEHFGCPTLTTNPFLNTRTVKAKWFGVWFTNGNNYHVEHHFLPGVPNDKMKELHKVLEPRMKVVDNSFFAFYAWFFRKLFKGESFDVSEN